MIVGTGFFMVQKYVFLFFRLTLQFAFQISDPFG